MFQKLHTETKLLRFAIKVHFRTLFCEISTHFSPQSPPTFNCGWDFYSLSNVLGRSREEDEMGPTCCMSVRRLKSASTLTVNSSYLKIINTLRTGDADLRF